MLEERGIYLKQYPTYANSFYRSDLLIGYGEMKGLKIP